MKEMICVDKQRLTETRVCILFTVIQYDWLYISITKWLTSIVMSGDLLHSSSVPASKLSWPDLGTNCPTSSSVAVRRISVTDSCSEVFTTVGHPQGMVFRAVNFPLALQLHWGYEAFTVVSFSIQSYNRTVFKEIETSNITANSVLLCPFAVSSQPFAVS